MNATKPMQKTVADGSSEDEEIVLETTGSHYGYLGVDGEDRHHHVDEANDVVYVTDAKYEEFERDGLAFGIRVTDPAIHEEDLTEHDDRGLAEWIDFVDTEWGWNARPVDPCDALRAAIDDHETTFTGEH